jgi:uncharacterized membrane protein
VAVTVSVGTALVVAWYIWFKRLFKPALKTTEKPKPSEELLKNDVDRVLEILKEVGGKMYQNDMVKRMDLSKSKVSDILSSLEREGKIRRLRTGRKNLVMLPPAPEEGAAKTG